MNHAPAARANKLGKTESEATGALHRTRSPSQDQKAQGKLGAEQERRRQERIAAAKAEEDRIRREAEEAEAERIRLWTRHAPKREKALADLAKLQPLIEKLESEVDAAEARAEKLRRCRSALRATAQKYGRPVTH